MPTGNRKTCKTCFNHNLRINSNDSSLQNSNFLLQCKEDNHVNLLQVYSRLDILGLEEQVDICTFLSISTGQAL